MCHRYFLLPAAIALFATVSLAQSPVNSVCRDLKLTNGRIHTMDQRDSIVSSVAIHNGRFADSSTKLDACAKTINLHGRTVLPGLIDNHNHIVLLGLRPGHDTRLELASSIADVQATLRERAKTVPAGEWITAMGGWNQVQFKEKRLPALAELDAADSSRPVIVFQSFTGPAAVNTLAKQFLTSKSVVVSDTGLIAANAPSVAALNALRSIQTFEDKKRGTQDAMAYAVRNGITTSVDMGAFVIPGTPEVQDSFTFDGLASADPFHMYDAFLALHRENKMSMRLRMFFLSMDTQPEIPLLKQRLLNSLDGLGDDMMRASGIGEFATQWTLFGTPVTPTNYTTALQRVASAGWPFQQHTLSLAEDQITARTFEEVNKITPVAPLRWSVAHVPHIDKEIVNRFKAVGAGIAIHPFEYLAGVAGAGPPSRMILESGIHAGAGSDAAQISTLNPWPMIYYMVTGKNSSGVLINDGQQISRAQAIRLYTAENGWFFREEAKLGSIEAGKLGDLVVLNKDYFDTNQVADEAIKELTSVLTVVDGKIVYDAMR